MQPGGPIMNVFTMCMGVGGLEAILCDIKWWFAYTTSEHFETVRTQSDFRLRRFECDLYLTFSYVEPREYRIVQEH